MPSRLLAGASILLLLSVSAASALTLDAASVTVRPARTDTFQLKGRLSAFSLDGADAVVVTLDRIAVRLPVDKLTRKRKVVTYRDRRPGARISHLRLDLGHRRFFAVGEDWALANLPNPLPVSIGTDRSVECRMTRFRNPVARTKAAVTPGTTPRVSRLVLAPGSDAGPCDAIGTPEPTPVVVIAGTRTEVGVEARVAASVDATSLRLVRLDAAGRTVGTPLCTLAAVEDDRFACATTVSEPSPVDVTLAVEGMAGGARVSSRGITLPVVPPHTDADRAMVGTAAKAVGDAWTDAVARLGDTPDARVELLRAMRAIPGIRSAELSPDGVDVTFRYTSGWMGIVFLTRLAESEPTPTVAPTRAALGAAVPAPASRTRGVFRSCGPNAPPDQVCCQPMDRRVPLLGRRVLIWDTKFFTSDHDDAPVIKAKLEALACLGQHSEEILAENADVASAARFPGADTLIVSSHGGVDQYDRVMIATGEETSTARTTLHQDDLDHGFVSTGLARDEYSHTMVNVYTITERYIQRLPKFPDRSIAYLSYCYSAYRHGLTTFIDKGVGVAFGYDWKVLSTFTRDVAPQLFDGLLARFQTAGDAYDAVPDKIDPQPQLGEIPGERKNTWLTFLLPAYFTYEGEPRIAYVGQPDVSPDVSALDPGQSTTLTATVEGAGTCELKYHWHNSGDAGDLTGDTGTNDFQSTENTATYTGHDEPAEPGDEIGVELLSPDSDPIGTSCAEATVGSTTSTTVTTTSTTLPGCGAGVLASATVVQEMHLRAQAFDIPDHHVDDEVFNVPQRSVPVGPAGATDAEPWDLRGSKGGATAVSNGSISYTISPCRVEAHGTLHESSAGGSSSGNAVTVMDTTLQIAPRVLRYTPYTITGSVRASGTAAGADATVMYLRCSTWFGVFEASLQNPTGAPVTFEKQSFLYPEDEPIITCAAKRGGASVGTGDDTADLDWSFTIDFQ